MDNIRANLEILRNRLNEEILVCFTCDIDWASEYAIEESLKYFYSADIPLTVFLTHKSSVITREIGNINAGIHPNFLQNSSQGNTFDEIIDFCFDILPNAICFRGHRYFEVNDIYEKLYNRGVRYASNTCTFLEVIPPFLHRCGLIQFPIFFEDGAYLLQDGDMSSNRVKYLFGGGDLES